MFRRIGKLPDFELMKGGVGPCMYNDPDVPSFSPSANPDSESVELWRKYKLTASGFECEIVEVFPDRDLFIGGAAWLDGMSAAPVQLYEKLEQYPKRIGQHRSS